MATSGTRDENRDIRAIAKIVATNTTTNDWDEKTFILTDASGFTVTFDAESGQSMSTVYRLSSTSYRWGISSVDTATEFHDRIANAINFAHKYGDLSMRAYADGSTKVCIYNLESASSKAQSSKDYLADITGTIYSDGLITLTPFVLTNNAPTLIASDLYPAKQGAVVGRDFTLEHYNLIHTDANYNITDDAGATPGSVVRQAPFSKRFQLLRASGTDQTTLG